MECINLRIESNDSSIKNNVEFYVKNKSVYYTILDGIEELENTKDVSKCIEKFEKINSISFDDDVGFDYFNQLDEHIQFLINPDSKLPMGIRWLDEVTHGGLLKEGKCLAVFMAQPGLGKSLMLGNLSYRWLKQNKTVIIISCEMSKDVYGRRIDALISNDDIDELHITHKETFSKIRQFKADHPDARLFIKEYPPGAIRTNDIKIYIDTLIAKGIKPDVIVIDYLNLVLPNYITGEGSYFNILQVSQNFRALSYLYECPVVTATQSNGDGINNANIGLEHISESKGTGHTGDFICALYQLAEDIEAGIINGKILKNRLGGKHGKVHSFKLNEHTLMLEDEDCGDVIEIRKKEDKPIENNETFDDDDILNI
jgi:archaellum biogenesis ATPase FlaH